MSSLKERFADVELGNKHLPSCYGYIALDLVPLEQTMAGMDYMLPEINRFVRLAKKHCTYPNDHNLNREESAAIYLYTMELSDNGTIHQMLNRTLRNEDRRTVRPWFRYLRLFDSGVSKLPTFKGTAWCATDGNVTHLFRVGQKVTWWGISSCSKSSDKIKSLFRTFTESTLFKIECSNAKLIGRYTSDRDKSEVILMPGTTFEVVTETSSDLSGFGIVHLKEMVDDVDPIKRGIISMY